MFRRSTASTARASATVRATVTMRQSSPRRLSGGRGRSPQWLRGRRLVGLRRRLARVLTPMCRHGPAEPPFRIWDNADASIPTSKFCATPQFPGQHLRAVPFESNRIKIRPSRPVLLAAVSTARSNRPGGTIRWPCVRTSRTIRIWKPGATRLAIRPIRLHSDSSSP